MQNRPAIRLLHERDQTYAYVFACLVGKFRERFPSVLIICAILKMSSLPAISDNGPITFFCPGSGLNYVDLNKTMLYVKAICHIMGGGGV
jgi:hypothetical protein